MIATMMRSAAACRGIREAALVPLLVLGLMTFLTACAGWNPVLFSVVIVVVFAGPHNWLEARYLLSKMPPRWGKLSPYFSVALGGVAFLAVSYMALVSAYWLGATVRLGSLLHIWQILFAAWISLLLTLRARQRPAIGICQYAGPVALGVFALALAWPELLSILMVFLHPLAAFLFLDRELAGRHQLRRTLRLSLIALPFSIGMLWIFHASSVGMERSTPGGDFFAAQLVRQVGAEGITGPVATFLIATHALLESLHYLIWIVAIPLLTGAGFIQSLKRVPLARRPRIFRPLALAVTVGLPIAVLFLWAGFSIDYAMTRDVYFTIAMAHVLAEIPFLLRAT